MIDLKKVLAYDENIIVNGDVFVIKTPSKVPVVCAILTSLEKTFKDESIKSIEAKLTNTWK